jgi:hypothetical protein
MTTVSVTLVQPQFTATLLASPSVTVSSNGGTTVNVATTETRLTVNNPNTVVSIDNSGILTSLGVSTATVVRYVGNGVQTQYALNDELLAAQFLNVAVSGIEQEPFDAYTTFTVNTATTTATSYVLFSEAPPNGADVVLSFYSVRVAYDVRGPTGNTGPGAEIHIGTVTSGTNASVTNTGTAQNAWFNFVLPQGPKGDTGTGVGVIAWDDIEDKNDVNNGPIKLAIGLSAGQIAQNDYAIALGTYASGLTDYTNQQEQSAIAIGARAGTHGQDTMAIAIGFKAADGGTQWVGDDPVYNDITGPFVNQGENSIAIGNRAGFKQQNANSIAIGTFAGTNSQQTKAIGIGYQAGSSAQGVSSVAIGDRAGVSSQSNCSVAIGYQAGYELQGTNSVAIGPGAGWGQQAANSIVINAQGTGNYVPLQGANSGLFINPIRNTASNSNMLTYVSTSSEVTRGFPRMPTYATDAAYAAAAGTPVSGNFYWDTTLNKMKVYSGSAWISLN